MQVQVLMVDDHRLIIEGYRHILASNRYGYKWDTVAAYSCEAAYNAIVNPEHSFDVVFLDLNLPPFVDKDINSGEDLIPLVKKYHPSSKIVILTFRSESMILFKVINEYKPDAILVKGDFGPQDLLEAVDRILKGEQWYSETIIRHQKSWEENRKIMDSYNQKIIMLLAQGVRTKNLPKWVHLSKGAIDKRKANIKLFLGIDKGTDEDIIAEARRQGLI